MFWHHKVTAKDDSYLKFDPGEVNPKAAFDAAFDRHAQGDFDTGNQETEQLNAIQVLLKLRKENPFDVQLLLIDAALHPKKYNCSPKVIQEIELILKESIDLENKPEEVFKLIFDNQSDSERKNHILEFLNLWIFNKREVYAKFLEAREGAVMHGFSPEINKMIQKAIEILEG